MDHNDLIRQQFDKQSATFGTMAGHYDALDTIVRLSGTGPTDKVLDVACGPGIVACAFAQKAGHVTGIDLVPAMIERARAAQQAQGLTNISWDIGNVNPLPYEHCRYSIVVSRFAFHHFPDPGAVLEEMVRVVKWEGRVVVVDVVTASAEQSSLFDALEKLRDPSHTHALLLDELTRLYEAAGLSLTERSFYRLPVDVEELLRATCTPPAESAEFRKIVEADIGVNKLGLNAVRNGGHLAFSFPIAILVGRKQPPENYGKSCCD